MNRAELTVCWSDKDDGIITAEFGSLDHQIIGLICLHSCKSASIIKSLKKQIVLRRHLHRRLIKM